MKNPELHLRLRQLEFEGRPLTMEDNGLLKPWVGRVWLNPHPGGNRRSYWST